MNSRVTKLQPTKRDPNRVMIRVDGKVVATLPRDVIESLGVMVDTEWTASLAERVDVAVDADKARKYAMNALGRRALSCGELADRIKRRGHSQAVADRVVEELIERGYLDDLAYARAVIRSERARKPAGPSLLRAKLFKKRVGRSVIDRAIAEADADYDQIDAARALAERRLRTAAMQKADAETRKRRLWGLLARRGFNVDTIRSAMDQLDLDADSTTNF
jgi:regulatory protein